MVIVTGAGGNFWGGGDLQIETMPMEDQKDEWTDYGVKGEYGEMLVWFANDYFHIVAQRMCRKLEDLPQVTIAAVDGIAVGIGLEMAVSCDLRIVSRPRALRRDRGAGGVHERMERAPQPARLIGQTRANEMILTGRFVFAEEAERIGLVNKAVPAESLLDEARAWAGRMCTYPALGLKYAKETIRLYQNQNRLKEHGEVEMDRIFEITRTADCAEGIAAFLEKRAPVYHPGAPVDKRARWQDD